MPRSALASAATPHTTETFNDSDAFHTRLARHGPELRGQLERLYGALPGFDAWFSRLRSTLQQRHAQRPAELKALDAQRAHEPDWFLSEHMLAYSAYVDRFGSTLNGVAQRIPHLRRLGVNYLHLLPFLRARPGQNDGGFAVESYDEVEPVLGNMSDLTQLAGNLRAQGISLCSDFVLNHVADTHAWARAARRGNARYRAYFHVLDSQAEVDAYEATLAQIFPLTAPGNFSYSRELAGWVWTTFYPYQWDLNYANPEVFFEMADALLRLANRGVEVFRLDSAAFLWKRRGTPCVNQPEAHGILRALRCVADIAAPATLLKAEAIVSARELPPYLGLPDAPGRECHLAYQSSAMSAAWVALSEGHAGMLRSVLQELPATPPHTGWLTYVRCHDDIGWNVLRPSLSAAELPRLAAASSFFAGQVPDSYARGAPFQASDPQAVHGSNGMAASLVGYDTASTPQQREQAQGRLMLLYGLALSLGGIPLVYMGDEFALGNDATPPAQWPAGADGRQLHRPTLHDEVLARADDATTREGAAFAALRHLVEVRRSLPAFGGTVPLRLLDTGEPRVLGFMRGSVACLFNFSDQACRVQLPSRARHDCLRGEALNTAQIQLAPYALRWLRLDEAAT